MKVNRTRAWALGIAAVVLPAIVATAGDWPMWGHDASRNMVSDETGLTLDFAPGEVKGAAEEVDPATTKNVRWVAKIGSQSYGNPTVSGGKVFLGTNNSSPRDKRYTGDRSALMAFDEKTGKFLWQLNCPKLGTGKVSDWEFLGICSSPAIVGNRAYVVTNRSEVVCLDTEGMANGNDGPFKDEGKYLAAPGMPAVDPGPNDADIIWRFDIREELGVFPHNISSSSILVLGDKLVMASSNGVDWTHTTIPNPKAPAVFMLDRNTGELLAEESEGISTRTLHSNWASPGYVESEGKGIILFGGGDGFLYGFDTVPKKADDGISVFNTLFKGDMNPPNYRMKDGKPLKYATPEGPSEVIATPVSYKGKVYVAIGQDPEHGEGIGSILCIDPTKRGDLTKNGGIVWRYDKTHRAISTPVLYNDLLFSGDFSGYMHCLDAKTGQQYWEYDTKSHIWGSPMIAEGKLFFGTEDGDFIVLDAAKTMKEIKKTDMRSPIYSTPVAANGTIFLMTPTHLYAIGK